jgi:transcriptional regulator with XRE-family HTH domain
LLMSSWDNLIDHLKDKAYRHNFVSEQINIGVPFQISELRHNKGWSQELLAEKSKMKQSRISQIENPDYGKLTINTLKRIASAFDIALIVRFAPFSELIDYTTSTPHIVRGISERSFNIKAFEEEVKSIELKKQQVQAQRTVN